MKILFCFFIIVSLFSCHKSIDSPYYKYLRDIHHCSRPEQYKVLLFLPQNSCPYCLSKIILFLNKHTRIPNSIGIVISGYGKPEISEVKSRLKNRSVNYLLDFQYKYLQYGLYDASTAFWLACKKDGTFQAYPLEANVLTTNLMQLQKAIDDN